MTHVTFSLTAKNRDQRQNPTLGNQVWATFTFFTTRLCANSGDCLERKREEYQNCSVFCCVPQICTHIAHYEHDFLSIVS